MLKIRDFAKLADVSMVTLRYYDEIGLLRPAHVDPDTGYRFYTVDQLPSLHRILAFKDLGLGLTQIAELLREGVTPAALDGMLRIRQAQLARQIQSDQEQLARVEARLRMRADGGGPAYEVVCKPVKAMTAAALRMTDQDIEEFAHWVDLIESLLRRYDARASDHLMVLHGEHADDYDQQSVELIAPMPLGDARALAAHSQGRLRACTLPACPQMASVLHHGHPALAILAYQSLGIWMDANGYTIVGPRRKIALRRGADLTDSLTEIQFPIEKLDSLGR
ncbi:MerR family transcriptional regulator [Chloroflexia bacterium SDU3-3]|nr:MerR family transcriptional regulator [Chloroflexia bacterium SDU3-3]